LIKKPVPGNVYSLSLTPGLLGAGALSRKHDELTTKKIEKIRGKNFI